MKQKALTKAAEHLELAKTAIEKLDLANGPKAYRIAWSDFLSQASRIYNTLEQGAKGCNASEPWYGRKRHERRKDPLLSYIHHARDSDEHGIDYVVAETGSSANVRLVDGAKEIHASFELMVDSTGKPHVRNVQSTTPEAIAAIELTEPRMELVTAKDSRTGNKFEPPEMHQGRPIVFNSPPTVASYALVYLEAMLDEAGQLPAHV